MIQIIIFITIVISTASADPATCNYSRKRLKIFQKSSEFYTCELSVGNSRNFITITDIDGEHIGRHSDDDVKFLIINKNTKLTEFSSNFCEKFPNLSAIKAGNVKIKSMDSDALQGCPNLQYIHLSDNDLREIPETFFSENAELLDVTIASNQLERLEQDMFEMQDSLKILNLNGNNIRFLPNKIFVPLRNLKILNLNNNQLSTLKAEWFKELENLVQLMISSNGIKDLPDGVFHGLSNLEALDLRSNSLKVIHSKSFPESTKIKYLELSFNKIDAIDADFVRNSNNIVGILMENNVCFGSKAINRNNLINTQLADCYRNYEDEFGTTPTYQSSSNSGTHPWMAALKVQNAYYCGGVLVSTRKVITTAKCVHKYKKSAYTKLSPQDIQIVLGSFDLTNLIESSKSIYNASKIYVHPKFKINFESNDNDIAVIILNKPVQFSTSIKSINIVQHDSDAANIVDGRTLSYGYTLNNKLTVKSAPKELTTNIMDLSSCLLMSQAMATAIGVNTFCQNQETSDQACAEDIGSGLIVEHDEGQLLRGILSSVVSNYADHCDEKSFSIYTDVMLYADWIESVDGSTDG